MIQSAETRLDGTTLIVRIPMRFQRRGGRKRIVAPDGSEIVPTSKPQPDGTLIKALMSAEERRFFPVPDKPKVVLVLRVAARSAPTTSDAIRPWRRPATSLTG